MIDVSVMILTKNEALHISRCLEKLCPLNPKEIFVIDCYSTDNTKTLFDESVLKFYSSTETQCHWIVHEWPGVHGKQINWALNNAGFSTKWILRIDADEYLTPEAIVEIKDFINNAPDDVTLAALPLQRTFWGKKVTHGIGKVIIPRIFRMGIGRCDDRPMDEKIVVSQGRMVTLKHAIIDDNLNSIDWWTQKHLDYADREARTVCGFFESGESNIEKSNMNGSRKSKTLYYKLPSYWRALAYWGYRYFIRGGFLDGKAGWRWHFFQGLWYRMMVDVKIQELKKYNNINH